MLNIRPEERDNRSPMEILAASSEQDQADFYASLSDGEAVALMYDWRNFLARPDQVAPDGDWEIWLILSGRGWGKTRTGSEWVKEIIATNNYGRIALVAETWADCRDVIVEGDSGIMSRYPNRRDRPEFIPTKRRLTWPNGAQAFLYNATEPDQLRGPQHDAAWSDELAKWQYGRETWDMLQFGLRIGDDPRQLVTTTPRPIELIKALVAGEEGKSHVTVGHTLDNASNLAPKYLQKIVKRYEGTRLGRQELSGQILGDIPNALFTQAMMDAFRVKKDDVPEKLGRIVVAVDHAVSEGEESNEHGVIVCGLSQDRERAYLLQDASLKGSPRDWASMAIGCFRHWEADAIVIEKNQGGDLVKSTLRSVDNNVPVIEMTATRGKHVRAEPISALYEQGRVHHVGRYPDLEQQMTLMSTAGYEGDGSPDRVDALVWALTELFPEMTDAGGPKIPKWKPRKVI